MSGIATSMKAMSVRAMGRLGRRAPPAGAAPAAFETAAFETYEARAPSAQNCIDAVPGWNTAFPPERNLVAGHFHGFTDDRMGWAMARYGDMAGASVLELGPMDGAHTATLHAAGATVVAVEANKNAFLRCLVTKELFALTRASFLLGDAVLHLEQDERRYDLIVACGVLYHMRDPLRFLAAVAARTDALYLWTSFIDVDVLEQGSELIAGFASLQETRAFHGRAITMYRLNYQGANGNADFCGGIYDCPRWMDRPSILASLAALGFDEVEVAHEDRPLPHQPCFSVFARRRAGREGAGAAGDAPPPPA